jgi:hypothetical protein
MVFATDTSNAAPKKQLNEILAFSPIRNKNNLLPGNSRLTLTDGFRSSNRKEKGYLINADDSIDLFRKEFSKLDSEKEKVRKSSIRNNFYK